MPKGPLGVEIKAFYHDDEAWPQGFYLDSDEDSLDPEELQDDRRYPLSAFGLLVEEEPPPGHEGNTMSFARAFHEWQRKQTHLIVVVEVPRSQLEAFTVSAKALGAKVR